MNRIYVSDVRGREAGVISTVDGHDIIRVERKNSFFNDVTDAELKAAAANGIKCVLLPLPCTGLGVEASKAALGLVALDHKDVITEGIVCTEVGYNQVTVKLPFANMDGLYDQCFGLVAVPVRCNFYNAEGIEELVILLMPAGAYAAGDLNFDPWATPWKPEYFCSDINMTEGVTVDMATEERMKEIGADVYVHLGYLDAYPDAITIVDGKVVLSESLRGTIAENTVPDIHAWVDCVGAVKVGIAAGELSAKCVALLAYRANAVVFPEPTEEELHPPQPEVVEEETAEEVPAE